MTFEDYYWTTYPDEVDDDGLGRGRQPVINVTWGNDNGDNRANSDGCGSKWDDRQTTPVGSFTANAWVLHDMRDNVYEWVQDCWKDSYAGPPGDGSA